MDLWTDPRLGDCTTGQIDGEAGWWTKSGNIELPPLARVMGVGRQQHKKIVKFVPKAQSVEVER